MQIVFDGFSPQGKRAIEAFMNKSSFRWQNKLYSVVDAQRRDGNDVRFDMKEIGNVTKG
ncbi:hypothetical protein NTE19_003390 [Vibrio fluvialis]|nr:hypothetical protein [Vibrio fluvialis]